MDKIDLKQQKVLIIIAVALAVSFFYGKKILEKQNTKIAQVKNSISDYQKRIELVKEVNKLSPKFGEYKNLSWKTDESFSIMGKINEAATKYAVEIINFNPAGLSDRGNYKTFLMNLNIRAEYFSLSKFISAIEKLDTLTKVANIVITPEFGSAPESQGPLVGASLSIEAFIMKEQ